MKMDDLPDHLSYWHRIDIIRFAPPVDEFDNPVGNGRVELQDRLFRVIKRTPKGVWICLWDRLPEDKRFILFNSKRQFASPSFEQAKEKFKRRKLRQISILKAQIYAIETALEKLDSLKPDTRPGELI